MRLIAISRGPWTAILCSTPKTTSSNLGRAFLRPWMQRGLLTTTARKPRSGWQRASTVPAAIITGGLLIWWLYPTDDFARLSSSRTVSLPNQDDEEEEAAKRHVEQQSRDQPAWADFARRFENVTLVTDREWSDLSYRLTGYLPDWSRLLPGYLTKLQDELSMSPGSLADEIWQEAHDPYVNPEIRYSAQVRVSPRLELCDDEQEFLRRRRRATRAALALYLGLDEKDIHPDDVPTIAMCGSGGGLRALIAGTGSMLAAEEDGLFDCATYMSGVSGSCWLQTLYFSSVSRGNIGTLLDHLKARASTHIAYPPIALNLLVNRPTNKFLLSGLVEKLKGDPGAELGLVDIYGLLLAARFLVPKGELGVKDDDFKLSNQRQHVKFGQRPLPIYTAVRHELPDMDALATESATAKAESGQASSWFQWFEVTPYEFFCEEIGAGIPTWAMGRKFKAGKDVPPEHGFHSPEIGLPFLMGVFGSAFCATLRHYYREIRPLIQAMTGFGTIDAMVWERNEDLSRIHPINPASVPNFAYQMQGMLSKNVPKDICEAEYIQLMDAGMSNNLPIYPLLRPDRQVDVIIAFDASADVKTDNWLSVVDGYVHQRGIKGWPVGIGWPKPGSSVQQMTNELAHSQASTPQEAEQKVLDAEVKQEMLRRKANSKGKGSTGQPEPGKEEAGDLGYCTVWVGTTEERSKEQQSPTSAIGNEDSWRLMEPGAGIAVVYLPFVANPSVPGIGPGLSDFLSTWNFIYTPEQIDSVVRLAKANYDEGREKIRSTIRAVYERKKQLRQEAERQLLRERYLLEARRAEAGLVGE